MIELTDTPEQMIKRIAGVEAGYVNNKDDLGGETNHGVTKAVALENAADLKSQFGWDGTMINLSQPMALFLFKKKYWNKMLLDSIYAISPSVADKMLDIGINSGTGAAVIIVQKFLSALNMKQSLYPDLDIDGGMGKKSLDALNALIAKRGKKEVVQRLALTLTAYQVVNAIEISNGREANETFTWGWLTRQWDGAIRYIGLTK